MQPMYVVFISDMTMTVKFYILSCSVFGSVFLLIVVNPLINLEKYFPSLSIIYIHALRY